MYRRSCDDVLAELGVAEATGLTDAEVQARLVQHGPNQLRQHATRSAWLILISQFKGLVNVLLVAASTLSFVLGDLTEGFAVLAVIAINAAIGFFTEIKATRSMEALHKMGSVSTRVRRNGRIGEIPAADLVPGDIVVLEGGDIITADLRIIEASKLECDESALTGESLPVSKRTGAFDQEVALADRRNMLYKGTALTRGSGAAVVLATGMHTELGQISSLVEEAQDESTPLEKSLDALGRHLVWIVLGITVLIWGVGVLRGKDVYLMLETAIALAVASIPEGLPIVATIALSRGMMRMARRQALVRRLASVETLGSTSIICTDKTGTLTENKMTVSRVDLPGGTFERHTRGGGEATWQDATGAPVVWNEGTPIHEAFRIGVLCNNALFERKGDTVEEVGDPLEVSLLAAGHEAGMERPDVAARMPEIKEDAFDSITKRMATYHQDGDSIYVAIKGAPEAVIASCGCLLTSDGKTVLSDGLRTQWEENNEQLARDGYRVLALACKRVQSVDEDPYENAVLVGLVGMVDPPRHDIRATIERCRHAGIRVVMVTGDQAPTALHVGEAVSILEPGDTRVMRGRDLKPFDTLSEEEKRSLREVNVFARVSPRQKLDLIALHQAENEIVAMTGDGVNDAPALKKADIGIAMGQRGTQVARQAAHVVLKDDSFKTIVYAIQEGRIIFGNIRQFVVYLLSCNIGEVLVILLASLLNTPLPVLPLQILLLNLVTDVFPALALGVGEGTERVMDHKPRPKDEAIATPRHWKLISAYGVMLGLCTLTPFFLAYYRLGMAEGACVTVAFLTLAFSQLLHVFNMREGGASLFANDVTRNPFVWGALALCTAILLLVVYVPALAQVLGTVPLGVKGWALIVPFSILPVLLDFAARGLSASKR
ncbi:MAG: HAD-IC family P-type ATPase [Nitrospiraceae bacterium]|nr:HAD-IC family P-type ATPase [Nitrospiraceae bacterium]